MFLWRISNHLTLDGRGGRLASARWHTQGRPVVYFAESAAGALMETLVHLELDYDHLPRTYQLLKAEAPDQAAIQTLAASVLPPNWVDKFIASRTIGDEWLASRKTALLRVPSAVMPETSNVLLNPEHPEASQVRVCWHRRYPWDRRLFE